MKDQHGLEMSGAPDAVSAYDSAVGQLLRFEPAVEAGAEAALALDPDCRMARVLQAYLGLSSSEWPYARSAAKRLAGHDGLTTREKRHYQAARRWAAGDWGGAGRHLDAILEDHPMDALALAMGHQIDFFLGDAGNLRGRVERVCGRWDSDHPNFGFVEGMLAFGLEECGDYGAAEAAGRRAVAANPTDVWANHAVAHVFEMQGRVDEGLAWLNLRRAQWSGDNFLAIHTAWHGALLALEQEDYTSALAGYDNLIHPQDPSGTALALLDAASLLWRLHLDGVDTEERFDILAQDWSSKDPKPWYVFNDLHAVMAFVGAGRLADAEAVIQRLDDFARDGDPALTNHSMVTTAGLAAARGLLAFDREDYAGTVQAFAPVRHNLSIIGGSHAQRDAFQRTLLVAAQRSGDAVLAHQLAGERLAARPTSAWTKARLLGTPD